MEFNFNTSDKEKVWKSESKDIIIEKPIFKEDEVKNKELSDILKILINKEKLGEFIKDNYEFKDILKDEEDKESLLKRAEFEKHLKEVGTELVVLDKMASEIDDKVRESI